MAPQYAQSQRATQAHQLVIALQRRFAAALESMARRHGDPRSFTEFAWARDDGRHGGGSRLGTADTTVFDRASINVSQVHYDDEAERRLASASAISTIIHPRHPQAPSFHMHISWTDMRSGHAYWRIMADLNPSIPNPADTESFTSALRAAAGEAWDAGRTQGDAYFFIPAAGRHRGVVHFYLEDHSSGDFEVDLAFARAFGEAVTDRYVAIVAEALGRSGPATVDERARQLAYHTLYLLQVLTLDRGTTSGLLVHDQNDLGILGSLPGHVDRDQLAAYRLPPPQDRLLAALVDALPAGSPSPVDDATRRRLAAVVREHYRTHPEALEMQASGGVVPPTVANHGQDRIR